MMRVIQWILELHVTSFNCWFLPLLMLNAKCDSEQDENGKNAANEKFQTALTIELASRIVAPQKVHETMRERESCNRHTFGTHFCIRWSRAFFSCHLSLSLFVYLVVWVHCFIWFWIMRANLADRKTLHSRAFSYVSLISYWQRFFFRSFPSLHTPSSMPNIKSLVYNQYMCTSYAREPLLIFCVVVVAKYLKCAYDFVIYLFGARSMMCKSSFLIFFVSFLLFLFICVNVRVLFAPCLSFLVQSIRNGKGRSNNNREREEANRRTQCNGNWWENYEWN